MARNLAAARAGAFKRRHPADSFGLGSTHLRSGIPLFAGQTATSFLRADYAAVSAASVCPQDLLYRAFFFQRYQPLFGSGRGMIAASSLAFSFVHIIFGNWLAVGLCCLGGLLFSLTYQRSGSLLARLH